MCSKTGSKQVMLVYFQCKIKFTSQPRVIFALIFSNLADPLYSIDREEFTAGLVTIHFVTIDSYMED